MSWRTTICLLALVSVAGAILPGCQQKEGDFTVLSTRSINQAHFSTEGVQKPVAVVGVVSKRNIILPAFSAPNLDEAIEQALQSNDAQLLTNATVYYKHWDIPHIMGEQKFEVRGNAVRTDR